MLSCLWLSLISVKLPNYTRASQLNLYSAVAVGRSSGTSVSTRASFSVRAGVVPKVFSLLATRGRKLHASRLSPGALLSLKMIPIDHTMPRLELTAAIQNSTFSPGGACGNRISGDVHTFISKCHRGREGDTTNCGRRHCVEGGACIGAG